jgi:hypothetical protein
MRKLIPTIIMVAMAFLWVANPALSQKRWKSIDMGEGCQEVQFLMSEEECAAEDAEKARLEKIRAAKAKEESIIRFVNFEMCESGQTISFAMSAEEIQKVMSGETGQIKEAPIMEQELGAVHDEIALCESGEKIIFYKLP